MNRAPRTDRDEAGEIILEALAEGGSLTLVGIKAANGWRFRLVLDESTFADLLNEEDRQGIEFRGESAWVDTWEEALALLDEYRWHMLYAGLVHPDFKRQVWAAVQADLRANPRKVRSSGVLFHTSPGAGPLRRRVRSTPGSAGNSANGRTRAAKGDREPQPSGGPIEAHVDRMRKGSIRSPLNSGTSLLGRKPRSRVESPPKMQWEQKPPTPRCRSTVRATP